MSKQVHVSHASCEHDKTPAARAKCRRIRRGGAPEMSKAQIVARAKGVEVPKAKLVKKAKGKRGVKIVDEAPAPILRELLTLNQQIDELEPRLSETLDVEYNDSRKPGEGITRVKMTDYDDVPVAVIDEVEDWAEANAPACVRNDVKSINVNVIAKGSKVVHRTMDVTATGDQWDYAFACTKKPVNVDTAKITTNDVTCKNCLKLVVK